MDLFYFTDWQKMGEKRKREIGNPDDSYLWLKPVWTVYTVQNICHGDCFIQINTARLNPIDKFINEVIDSKSVQSINKLVL